MNAFSFRQFQQLYKIIPLEDCLERQQHDSVLLLEGLTVSFLVLPLGFPSQCLDQGTGEDGQQHHQQQRRVYNQYQVALQHLQQQF